MVQVYGVPKKIIKYEVCFQLLVEYVSIHGHLVEFPHNVSSMDEWIDVKSELVVGAHATNVDDGKYKVECLIS